MEDEVVVDVDEAEFEDAVVERSREQPVVVDFWAGWCQPCLVLGPILERLAQEYGGRFLLARVDVDANPGLADRFRIQGIPAVKAFRDGRVVSEFVGVQPEVAIQRFLDEVVPSETEPLVVEGRAAQEAGDLGLAEAAYRKALALAPDDPAAAVGLGRILLARGDLDEARPVLDPVAHEPEARPVRAELALRDAAGPPDAETRPPLAAAAAEAVEGDPRAALEVLLAAVTAGGDEGDAARELMVRVFEMLGDDSPLVAEFRPRLARALY